MLFNYIDGGEPLGFNEIEKDLPAPSAKALLDSKWTFITQEVCFYFNFLLF
jgi:ubiquitin-like-conjugating enzyme ATG10